MLANGSSLFFLTHSRSIWLLGFGMSFFSRSVITFYYDMANQLSYLICEWFFLGYQDRLQNWFSSLKILPWWSGGVILSDSSKSLIFCPFLFGDLWQSLCISTGEVAFWKTYTGTTQFPWRCHEPRYLTTNGLLNKG